MFTIHRAVDLLNQRGEREQNYTVFSDSQTAIFRVQHEECGPAQTLARITIDASHQLWARGNDVTIRWTPSHQEVAGNERADACAKAAAARDRATAEPANLREASLSYLSRITTKARTIETERWIQARVKRKHQYRPPTGGKMRSELQAVRKECTVRFYQLLSGHAATAPHLESIGQVRSGGGCWWCKSGQRQSRFHLFFRCRRWRAEINEMWQKVQISTEG